MQTDFAVDALTALANPIRLELYRLLVRRGPLGISADDIAATLGLAPSALVTSMALLERGARHLLAQQRNGIPCRQSRGRSAIACFSDRRLLRWPSRSLPGFASYRRLQCRSTVGYRSMNP
jgi:predicted transcriptional regulator